MAGPSFYELNPGFSAAFSKACFAFKPLVRLCPHDVVGMFDGITSLTHGLRNQSMRCRNGATDIIHIQRADNRGSSDMGAMDGAPRGL
jgi:hypothetical protein